MEKAHLLDEVGAVRLDGILNLSEKGGRLEVGRGLLLGSWRSSLGAAGRSCSGLDDRAQFLTAGMCNKNHGALPLTDGTEQRTMAKPMLPFTFSLPRMKA